MPDSRFNPVHITECRIDGREVSPIAGFLVVSAGLGLLWSGSGLRWQHDGHIVVRRVVSTIGAGRSRRTLLNNVETTWEQRALLRPPSMRRGSMRHNPLAGIYLTSFRRARSGSGV